MRRWRGVFGGVHVMVLIVVAIRRRGHMCCARRLVGYDVGVVGHGEIGGSDDVLAVLFVVPRVTLDSLASNAELFGLDLHDFEVKGKFHAAPVVTNTDTKRIALNGQYK